MAEKVCSDKQLLEAMDTEGLTLEQITRRTALIKMQTEERALDAANDANEKFKADKEQALRKWKAVCLDILKNDEEQARIQTVCAHNTGGQDRKGFYDGTGEIYGACISKNILPTGEVYALCFRCHKEFHHPSWVERYFPGCPDKLSLRVAVMRGLFPLAEYMEMESSYLAALRKKARTFEGASSELPGSVQFSIPTLKQRMDREAAEFQQYVTGLPARERNAAGVRQSA